jgi:homoserine dehydrogenase
MPSASAVLGDLVDAAHNLRAGASGRTSIPEPAVIHPFADTSSQYYLSLEVADRPGVLATVAGVFGEHGVSIRSMEQEGLGDEARLIFITHTAVERDMQATLTAFRELDAVDRVGTLLRVVGQE